MKRNIIPLALVFIFFIVFLVAPVSAGLIVTNGEKIISPYGNTSAILTVADSDISSGSTITIDVINTYYLIYSGKFTDANLVISSDAANATWTGTVSSAGDLITLISAGNNTTVGENITVTFTGSGGNPWMPGTADIYGDMYLPLTVTRTDTSETATINFWIETASIPPGGLTITDGVKITSPNGATSPVITIADSDIPAGGTITIAVPDLFLFVKSGTFTDANIIVNDTASAATWSGVVSGETGQNKITLTSTDGNTSVGENITVTFTGAGGNPWGSDTSSQFGDMVLPLTVTRIDTFQTAYINFDIETTPPPGGLTISPGAKITASDGATSPVITIADSNISSGSTITIDASGLSPYISSGVVTDANVEVNDSAEAATWTGAVAGNILTLTSTGGNTTASENITVTFTGAGGNPWIPNTHGIQIIPLTVVRTDTSQKSTFDFEIETIPPANLTVVANFTASPTSDLGPLTVALNDTSLGSPTLWIWDFGDGNTSTEQNPVHTYYDIGKFTVALTATNAYGSDTKTEWDYIKVLNGGIWEANTSIAGLTFGAPAGVIVRTDILNATLIPNNSVLEIQPPPGSGFSHITLYEMDGTGFYQNGNFIFGSPTLVHLVTDDITPPTGFSNNIGTKASFNYSIDLPSYPFNALLNTKIWEGVIPEYDIKLRQILDKNNAGVVGTAYTAKVTKINFPPSGPVNIQMSIDSNWNTYPNLPGGPGMMYIWRIAEDGNSGQVLPTNYLYNDTMDNLDYYEADSPLGMSTFGLSSLTGNNNPFQIVALIAAQNIHPPNNPSPAGLSGGGGGSYPAQTTVVSGVTSADQNYSVKIYSNDKGTITQATILRSNDGLARISLDPGITARTSSGMPLESLSIRRISERELPAEAPATLSFAGMAYELGPDGTTFFPAVPLSFTIPPEIGGQEYIICQYDHTTGTWEALPGLYDPETRSITVQISHLCCIALFAQSPVMDKPVTPEPTILVASKSTVQTNVEIYGWFISLILKNPVSIVIIIAVLAMVAYFGWWKRRL
jgi:PKD repeat protein